MIKILQIGLGLGCGGVGNTIMNYYRHIDRNEFAFDFVDIYGHGITYADEIKQMGGKIYTLDNFKKKPLKSAIQFHKVLQDNHYDIIHINLSSAANLIHIMLSCAHSCSPKVIAHAHCSGIRSGILRNLLHNINHRKLCNMPVEKWACSMSAGQWLWGKDFNEKNIIPNAIDTQRFSWNEVKRNLYRNQMGFQDSDYVIGYVGRLTEEKNVLFLPEILFELRRLSSDYKMLIIGDGMLRKVLEEKIKKIQLEKYISFVGYHEDTSGWYSSMDSFVLPSKFEGFGLAGLEAQACGIPCFVSENIPLELNVTKRLHYLSINNGAGVWASAIAKQRVFQNKFSSEIPNEYKISFAALELERRYIDLVMKNHINKFEER